MLKTDFTPFPVLSTTRLILRQISLDDRNEIYALRSDPAVMKYIGRVPAQSVEDAITLITAIQDSHEKKDGITWGITMKDSDKLIGTIGFWKITKEHFRAEIGYALQTAFHGKGIMHEAMVPVLEYGFKVMNLHSVEAVVDPANEATIRLLEKNGFVREGYFRENFFFDGKFLDSGVYSLLQPKPGAE